MPETEQSPRRIQARKIDAKALQRIIDQLSGGAPAREGLPGDAPRRGRWSELHRLISVREQHYYNRPEADPVLPEPYDKSPLRMQSDILRRTHIRLKARMTENPVLVEVTPNREIAAQQQAAQRLETILQRGYEQVIERQGIDPQADLADGQSIAAFGVLHWQKAADLWPDYQDAEELDELPEDEGERKRYRERDPEIDGEGKPYRETAESEGQRNMEARARAGYPWYIEVLHPTMVSFITDRSFANGLAAVLVMRNAPVLEYAERLSGEGIVLDYQRLNQHAERLRIYDERERPAGWHPSADQDAWGREVRIAQYWTRDEFYEAVHDGAGWQIVKSFPHPYEMPPFAIARAQYTNHPDPVLAYEPAMTGLYRTKPFFDFFLTMEKIIAANIGLPMYWIKLVDDSMLLEDGKPVILTRNSMHAQVLPPGATFEKVDFEMNPAFVAALERAAAEMEQSAPATGQVEITASTQPWTARLGQSQANVEPAMYVKEQARAFRVMFRNQALVMSKSADDGGFGQAIGVMDSGKVVSIEPDEIANLQIDVHISPTSSSERITSTEHGVTIWGRGVISRRKLYEDYMQEEDPQALEDEVEAEHVYTEYMRPQVVQQELARRQREFIVLNAQGGFSGPGGVQMTPDEVLAANGVQSAPVGQLTDPIARSVGGQTALPGLPGMSVPGAGPMNGMQGF